ncbi:MAG: hypothetical protein A2096_02005 [Spirochaetes bacterium GWF1_41_5]|nr:MAG: hypothetical protein A2096_02005 [Spirochaetes bacterium GWF1_41_5]HBE02006.1 hypothetical protein [Spirochaetia bacterium]
MVKGETDLCPQKYKKDFPKIAIIFPGPYLAGMSSLAFHALRRHAQVHGNVSRFFIENNTPVSPDKAHWHDMDFFLFTFCYESQCRIFENISLLPGKPVMAGGPLVSTYPEYFRRNFNVSYRGDLTAEFFAGAFKQCGTASGLVTAPARKTAEDSPECSSIIAAHTEFPDTFLIEISSGCTSSCAFCLVRALYQPRIFFRKEKILSLLSENANYYGKVGLIAPSVNEHPEIKSIMRWCLEHKKNISFSSIRLDRADEEFLELYALSGQKSLSCAPETFAARLQKKIGKNTDYNQYLKALRFLVSRGIASFKLYMLCGLPGENDGDNMENIKTVLKLQQDLKTCGVQIRLGISLNPLAPKPLTALAQSPLIGETVYKKISALYRRELAPAGISFKAESYRAAECQYAMAKKYSSV